MKNIITFTDGLTRENIKQGQGSFGDVSQLFSKERGSCWSSGNTMQQIGDAQGWVAVNLGSPRCITEFELNFNGHEGRHRAGSITFAVSNNPNAWALLTEGPGSLGTPFPLQDESAGLDVFYKGTAASNSGLKIMAADSNIITCDMFRQGAPIIGQYVIIVYDWQQYALDESNRAVKGDSAFAVHIFDWFIRGEAILSLDLNIGDTIVLTPPPGFASTAWQTADTNYVSVTENGTVTALAPGKAVVTISDGAKVHKVVVLVLPVRSGIISDQFLAQHPGNTRTATVMPRDMVHPTLNRVYTPFDTLNQEFGRNNPDSANDAVEGATNSALLQFPGDPMDPATGAKRHLQSVWDEELQRYVMQVNLFGNNYVDGVLVSCEEGCYRHGPQDRQRVELKANNHYLYGRRNELSATRYLMKIPAGLNRQVHGFFHIFQYKAVVSTPNDVAITTSDGLGNDIFIAQSRNSEAGMPILTLTVTETHLQFRHSPTGAGGSVLGVLAEAPISEVENKWLDINIQVLNAVSGWVSMEMRCAETGKLLMKYGEDEQTLVMWRRPEINFPTEDGDKLMAAAFEGRPDQHNRFKWGIYRSANKALLGDAINDVSLYLADITIYRPGKEGLTYPPHHISSTIARPVNLASGAACIDVTEGTDGNSAFQRLHNVPSRVTDDLTSPYEPFNWVSPAANNTGGSLVLDLGQPLDFSDIKAHTNTKGLKSVSVSLPNIPGQLSETQMREINNWDKAAELNCTPNDTDCLNIHLGKTHTHQYVRLDFTCAEHSESILQVSEIEVFNLAQPPANVIVEHLDDGNAKVIWEPVPGAVSYTIYDGAEKIVNELPANVTSAVVSGVDASSCIGVGATCMCRYSFRTTSSLPKYADR